MTTFVLLILFVMLAAGASLLFSGLSYSLRDVARGRLQEELDKRHTSHLYHPLVDHSHDLVFITSVLRLLANTFVIVCLVILVERTSYPGFLRYGMAAVLAFSLMLFSSVTLPNAIAKHSGEPFIAFFARPLNALRIALAPMTGLTHWMDEVVRRATDTGQSTAAEKIEEKMEDTILSVVEEGEKEGIVDVSERKMIESVIEFRGTTTGQIMTTRQEVVGIPVTARLNDVKRTLEESGLSRLPVHDGSLDKIVGVLYARDLLKYLGLPTSAFGINEVMRRAYFVHRSKPVKDLLNEFRVQKVHMAIVLDEYGSMVGLVTIEDILEELVGEISDEHEPQSQAMLKQVAETVWEAEGRTPLAEANRVVGLNIPEDDGYETLGGYLANVFTRIPNKGAVVDQPGVRYTILESAPNRVDRVRIELTASPAPIPNPAATPTPSAT